VPDHLVFRFSLRRLVQDKPIKPAVEVAVVDKDGNVTPSSGLIIHMALVPSDGGLRGTTDETTLNGVAVFDNLKVHSPGTGYVLVAYVSSRPDLGQVQSAPFEVKKR
jgi:hypothetical protein